MAKIKLQDFDYEEGDEFIEISAEEFYDECGRTDKEQLIDLLRNEGEIDDLGPDEYFDKCNVCEKDELARIALNYKGWKLKSELIKLSDSTYIDEEFFNQMMKLVLYRNLLTLEDERTLLDIAKEY